VGSTPGWGGTEGFGQECLAGLSSLRGKGGLSTSLMKTALGPGWSPVPLVQLLSQRWSAAKC